MAQTLTENFATLRRLSETVPRPPRLPTYSEISDAENVLGLSFHPDFRRYLLEVSDVTYGIFEPVTITVPGSPNDLATITIESRKHWQLPSDYSPICESNSEIYCVTPEGKVIYWPHDGTSKESWPNLASWIENVWIGESHQ